MIVTIETVLQEYESLLAKRLTYDQADRWAWNMMQLQDEHKLVYEPPEDERLLWELILYLYGIDMPDSRDLTKPITTDLDIVDFLKQKGVYRL